MRSVQSGPTRKGNLLSPPEVALPTPTTALIGDTSNEVTIRPKRHGIITPRGVEGAAQTLAMSPSALHEAFRVDSRPHSRTGSANSNSSFVAENFLEAAKLVFNMLNDLSQRLNTIRPQLEGQHVPAIKTRIEVELNNANANSELLSRSMRRAQGDRQQAASRVHFLRKPIMDSLTSVSALSRLLSRNSWVFCHSPPETYRSLFWEMQQDMWEVYIANDRLSKSSRSAVHSRNTSTSSRFNAQPNDYSRHAGALMPAFDRPFATRNGTAPSPTGSAYSGTTLQTAQSSFSSTFSPLMPEISPNMNFMRPAPSLTSDGPTVMRHEDLRQEAANDPQWEDVLHALRTVCNLMNEYVPIFRAHYFKQRQLAARNYHPEHDVVKELEGLVNNSAGLIDASGALTKKVSTLSMLGVNIDRGVRHSPEFWQLCRALFMVSILL
jgi:hypothetical protein